jgi:hypothetical protein
VPQLPEPRRGHDDDAKPAPADISAVATDVDPSERIAAQLPQILVMNDASDGSEMRSRIRELSRRNQHLRRVEDGHYDSMGTCSARSPPLACKVRRTCPILSLTWGSADSRVGPDSFVSHVVVVRLGSQIHPDVRRPPPPRLRISHVPGLPRSRVFLPGPYRLLIAR